MTPLLVVLAVVFVGAGAFWFFEIDFRRHTRDTSRFADPLWARFDAAMDKATKPSGGKK